MRLYCVSLSSTRVNNYDRPSKPDEKIEVQDARFFDDEH